ncbi:MAG: alpha/beta hydrolase [Blautia sp.]|nr:alpha/beta hydrolase [Blautia sp.]
MSRLAVFFPGIGYTVDKPLMHYSRRLAMNLGYEIRLLPYTGFPPKVRGDRGRMEQSFLIALEQSRQMLADTDFTAYEEILFVGKSIGTIAAAQIASESPVKGRIRLVLYTPLDETFLFPCADAVVFTGDDDPWAGGKESRIASLAAEKGYPCFRIPDANHSLESRDLIQDIRNMEMIMRETEAFMKRGRN